jgi:DNA-directed RNA polymerase specialized sigma24 family protein
VFVSVAGSGGLDSAAPDEGSGSRDREAEITRWIRVVRDAAHAAARRYRIPDDADDLAQRALQTIWAEQDGRASEFDERESVLLVRRLAAREAQRRRRESASVNLIAREHGRGGGVEEPGGLQPDRRRDLIEPARGVPPLCPSIRRLAPSGVLRARLSRLTLAAGAVIATRPTVLRRHQHSCFTMAYVQRLTLEEIAARLRVGQRAAYMRIRRVSARIEHALRQALVAEVRSAMLRE